MEGYIAIMLTVKERVLLLDEVASTAFGSWQIQIALHDKFSKWPEDDQDHPAYTGYTTMRVLLSHSLIVACYALLDSNPKAYSFCHAVNDPDLKVTDKALSEYEECVKLRGKIATYRNNVSAHVNSRRTQSDWAMLAGIKNREFDVFIRNARSVVTELGKANIDSDFIPSSHMAFYSDFHEFCRAMAAN